MSFELVVTDIPLLLPMTRADDLGARTDAAVAFADGRVAWVGPSADAPDADRRLDGAGCIGLPGLVDFHTHTVWAGSRADEFQRRLAGATYTEILEAGGGILSTVAATRATPVDGLAALAAARLRRMRARGVTTVEIKGGYGLSVAAEVALLTAAARAGATADVHVLPTFLGAHAVPAEHRGDRSAYVRQVVDRQLPACAPLAWAVDVYCDRGAFDLDESLEILTAGRDAGLRVRAHAEQVAYTGIAAAAAALGATCVDHLERLPASDVGALADHGTVAGLLPGAQLYLHDSAPPVAALREAGVRMAVGSDLNPGSSPVHDLWACATLACLLQGLTVPEALLGITAHAADALGCPDRGRLQVGSPGDLVLVRPPPGEPLHPAALVQQLGGIDVHTVVRSGRAPNGAQ
ncbi:MAG: imidazolonepropionase [Alphaproteobacteria bacterium]|nr:imidazolonepropionase [Alphaproteobacteria bacterium]